MKKLDMKKIKDAALTYYRHKQSEKEKTQKLLDDCKSRIARMREFTNEVFNIDDSQYINDTINITEAFCAASVEPSDLNGIETLLIDFAFLCEALVSASSHTHYRLTVTESAIFFEPH